MDSHRTTESNKAIGNNKCYTENAAVPAPWPGAADLMAIVAQAMHHQQHHAMHQHYFQHYYHQPEVTVHARTAAEP